VRNRWWWANSRKGGRAYRVRSRHLVAVNQHHHEGHSGDADDPRPHCAVSAVLLKIEAPQFVRGARGTGERVRVLGISISVLSTMRFGIRSQLPSHSAVPPGRLKSGCVPALTRLQIISGILAVALERAEGVRHRLADPGVANASKITKVPVSRSGF
jgi:hypothetical protein